MKSTVKYTLSLAIGMLLMGNLVAQGNSQGKGIDKKEIKETGKPTDRSGGATTGKPTQGLFW